MLTPSMSCATRTMVHQSSNVGLWVAVLLSLPQNIVKTTCPKEEVDYIEEHAVQDSMIVRYLTHFV